MKTTNYIVYFRNLKGLSQAQLGKIAGVSGSYISQIESGSRGPSFEILQKIASALDVTPGVLLDGPSEVEPHPMPDLSDTVPLLTSIPAGPWKTWIDSYPPGYGEGRVPRLGLKGEHIFALKVSGDSMMPLLAPGDVLYVDPELPFTRFHGGIAVVKFNGDIKVRSVWKRGDNYLLEPANKLYQPEMVPMEGTTLYKVVQRLPRDEGMF